jgi:hypothetical protein
VIVQGTKVQKLVSVCAEELTRGEFAEIGLAAQNHPEALTRALFVYAYEEFTSAAFARMFLRVARDVNQRKGLAS